MKKTMTALVALLLSLGMLLSFTACGGDAANTDNNAPAEDAPVTLVGKWVCDLEMSDMLNQWMGDSLNVSVDSFAMRLVFEFDENDGVKMALDEEHFKQSIPSLADTIVEQIVAQYGLSVEEYYAQAGMTREQFVQKMETEIFSGMQAPSFEGKYTTQGDRLWILSEGMSADDTDPMIYSLEGEALLLSAGESTQVPELLENFLPLALTRL